MSEPRRCRRCKRKRLDDEPPEVQQYKTCAKCRIIERTKKKLRKPLAEETMRYGLKQFHEQNQNANFIHEEIFYSEQLRKELEAFEKAQGANGSSSTATSESHSQPQQHHHHQQQQQQQRFSLYQGPADVTSIANAAVNASVDGYLAARNLAPRVQTGVPGAKYPPQSQYLAVAVAAQAVQAAAGKPLVEDFRKFRPDLPLGPLNCELCMSKLDPNDSIHYNYRLCHKCYEDPFNNDNVFASYNDYLLHISTNSGKKDLNNLIFICEMDSLFTNDLESHKPIITELQFRQFVLDSLKNIYLDPIIASIRVKFNHISNNVNEVNANLNTVTNNNYNHRFELFKQTNPVKFYYKSEKQDEQQPSSKGPEASIYLNYNPINNLLIIKINYKLNKSVNYLNSFLKFVKTLVDEEDDYNFDDDITAIKVYNYLTANSDKLEAGDQQFLLELNKDQFVSDFKSLPDRFKADNADDLQKQLETHIAAQIATETAPDSEAEPVASTAVEPVETEQPVDPVFEP